MMPDTIAQDVPCFQCGYDLRGLQPDGQCPECAAYISASLGEWKRSHEKLPPLSNADPRWLRETADGLIASAVAWALTIALSVAPDWFYRWRSPQRRFMLGIASTAWVLSWFGVWKIAARPRPAFAGRLLTRQWLRFSAPILVAAPIAGVTATWEWLAMVLGISFLLGLPIGCFCWFVYAAHLLQRGAGRASALVWVVRMVAVIAVPLSFLFMLPALDADVSSLAVMCRIPMVPFGSVNPLSELVRELLSHNRPYWLEWIVLILPLSSALILARLLVVVHASARAARERRTAANSHP